MSTKGKLTALLLFAVLFFGLGIYVGRYQFPYHKPEASELTTCFVPQQDCTQFVVNAIHGAQWQILVQAYNFTSPPILQALAEASDRHLDVRIILDKSNEEPRYSGGKYEQDHGVPVLTDFDRAIAHSKVMVFDQERVLTGSFNFSVNAQKRNAENTILIYSPELAKIYLKNWQTREAQSRSFHQRTTASPSHGHESE